MDARHQYLASRISESLDVALTTVQYWMSSNDVMEGFGNFFKSSGPGSITVGVKDDGLTLYLFGGSKGMNSVQNKAVYFQRISGKGVTPNTCENDVMFGEIKRGVVEDFTQMMDSVFLPLVKNQEDWQQKQSNELSSELFTSASYLSKALQDCKTNMHTGVRLELPEDKKWLAMIPDNKPKVFEKMAMNTLLVNAFLQCVNRWCSQMEQLLEDTPQTKQKAGGSKLKEDEGPRTELVFWRNRCYKFCTIIDQLKCKDYKTILGVLREAKSLNNEAYVAIKKWRALDNLVTDAANEAKDNVKYLITLDKYVDVLYTGNWDEVAEVLPSLMTNIKIMMQISRHYNTFDRMTTLCWRVTNQLINFCKAQISHGEKLWDRPTDVVLDDMRKAKWLYVKWLEAYENVKNRTVLIQAPTGEEDFAFDEEKIFGHMEMFVKRLDKVIEMFVVVQNFNFMAAHQIEGMGPHMDAVMQVFEETKRKPYDLLDYTKTAFDRDDVEFRGKIAKIELELQSFVNSSFEVIPNTEMALDLLKKCKETIRNVRLQEDLTVKSMVIFQNYGLDLDFVQKTYEKCKTGPPMVRNLPPVAGSIVWSRQLLRRISTPMDSFQQTPAVMEMKEGKKIIRTYNLVATALIEFETLWHTAWCDSVEVCKAGLHATLLTKHFHNPTIYANFDPAILQLIREAKCLCHLGVAVPENARIVLDQDVKFKTLYGSITNTLKTHAFVVKRINPVVKGLMANHLEELENIVKPGLTTVTWTSLCTNNYLAGVDSALARVDDIVSKVNDIVENRVDKNLKQISQMSMVDLAPERFPFAVDEFVNTQEFYVKTQSAFMDGKNLEVELAVTDLVDLVVASGSPNLSPAKHETNVDATKILFRHYNRLMYHAILASMKLSFNQIKARIVKDDLNKKGLSALSVSPKVEKKKEIPCFFIADVEMDQAQATAITGGGKAVVMKPSLEGIQDVINRTAIQMLRSTKRVIQWGQNRGGPGELVSFYDELAREKDVCKMVLLLTGALLGAELAINSYLDHFLKYRFLWEKNMQKAYQDFLQSSPTLEDFDDELSMYVQYEEEFDKVPEHHAIGVLSLRSANIKADLRALTMLWKTQYARNLLEMAREDLDVLVDYISTTSRKFSMEIEHLDDVRKLVALLREVREKDSNIEWDIRPLEEKYDMLQRFGVKSLNQEELHQVSELRKKWQLLKETSVTVTDYLSEHQSQYKKNLTKDVKAFVHNVKTYRTDFETNGPGVKGINPAMALERLNRHEGLFFDLDRKYTMFNAGEVLFGMPQTNLNEMTKTRKELKLQRQLFGLYEAVEKTVEGYNDIMWTDVVANIEAMTNTVNEFQRQCKNMPRALKEWDAYTELKQKIEDLLETVPLLQYLSNKAMRPRHWDAIQKATKCTFNMDPDTFKVGHLLDANLIKVAEDVEDISSGATKELNVEMKLREINDQWADSVFGFSTYKGRSGVWILKGGEAGEIQEALEESLMNLGGMASSRYALPFKEDVDMWLSKLGETSEVIERWLYLQMLWMNLEAVFTGGDIAKQLPIDSKRFVAIDKTWIKLMTKAVENRNVVGLCYNNDMLKFLQPLIEGLEICQKSLASYLEQKRALFPRFYFVADPTLLEILSQGSDPPAIQPYFQACFDSVDFVTFDDVDKKKIIAINADLGVEKETVELTTPVVAEGNIEEWMFKIELEMRSSLHDIVRQASVDCLSMDIATFISGYNSQTCLLGIMMQWSLESQVAISNAKTDKKALDVQKAKTTQLMMDLCVMTTDDTLGKRDRRNIETLITIEVHQKDVFDDVWRKKLKDPTAFDWMQQLRFYYRTDIDNTSCECCDRAFPYCYEFLGCEERLVITPLTDRCYISLTQALGMIKGGAPAGPAGTGKTETTKDLARGLGKYCVVTNCGPEMDIRATGKIFKGLAMCGAWGCFDEFNRIDLEVLSVCAQQIACVLNAIREKVKTFVFLDGQTLSMNTDVGYFITMNPGYAGRQNLPENLKALFRGVMMMVPDRQIIMKVKLAGAGYQEYAPLSVKFHVLYSLCEQQLSKQPHYDFGLRNILSVLRTAGAQLRSDKQACEKSGLKMKSESYLLCRTLRDMNMSKFVADDVGLFISLIGDLFPGLNPEKAVFPVLEKAIAECLQEKQLVDHPSWVSKIIQLYETYLVRHGIQVVGSAGCGKSTIIETLKDALTKTIVKHTVVRMNPKAITPKQMYGFQDPIANEWTEGTFTAIWRKSNDPRKKGVNPWMVMDGPVDAIWIEDLNTVLDDNRMLTVANGDRIPMLQNMKILFEPEDLRNASPATVSRAGIIYVSSNDLGWQPLIAKYCNDRPNPAERDMLRPIFQKYLTPSVVFNREGGVKQVLPVEDMNLVSTCCTNLSGILPELKEKDTPMDRIKIQRCMIMACLWSTGALFELGDRAKYETFLRNIPESAEAMPKVVEGRSLYDYNITDNFEWCDWHAETLNADPNKFDFSSLLVPTMDSARIHHFTALVLEQKKPVLLVGGPGTAKSSVSMMYIENQPKDRFIFKNVNFSSATTCQIFQNIVESSIDKRSGRIYGPPANKQLICFLDDVSMPAINNWGDQPTLEIIRQIIENKYLWNLDKGKAGEQLLIEDLIYILAMNHPGGGKNDIPHRMKRHCANWNTPMPSMSSIHQIFGAILRLRFNKNNNFKPEVLEVSESLVEMTMELYDKAKAKLLPTPAKFHYIFNLRDVSRVFQGVMTIDKKVCMTPTHTTLSAPQFLLASWKHECMRVYQDKLVDEIDKTWLDKCLNNIIKEKFDHVLPADRAEEELLLVDFLQNAPEDPETGEPTGPRPKVYEAVDNLVVLRARCEKLMQEMNDGLKVGKMFLVLFDDAVRHMARISRIISMPRGSALLVGVGGSGKQSLTRLATYIAAYKRFQVTVSKTYNAANLLEDIKNQYLLAGFAKPVTFVFTDAEVKDEGFLEYINMILSTGEIPGLVPKDEMEAVIGELSAIYEKEFGLEPNRVAVIKYFYSRVRANLHMVLCFSPVGEKFRDRALKFPALFSGTTIDWFLPWPQQALEKVANAFLSDFPVKVDNDKVKLALVNCIASTHLIVTEECAKYFTQFRRNVYVTPKSYLSFIDAYKQVYSKKFGQINEDAEKITNGLLKLKEAEADVAIMQVELAETEKLLAVSSERIEKMVVNLKEKAGKAEKVKTDVTLVKNELAEQAAKIGADRDATNKDLEAAKPALVAAEAALNAIQPDDIKGLKALKNPPNIIKRIFDGVIILKREQIDPVKIDTEVQTKGGKEIMLSSYKTAFTMMSQSKFLDELKGFNTDTITEETCELLFPYLEMDDFTTEAAAKASGNVAGLCSWCCAMVNYYFIAKFVAPKIESLKIAEAQLQIANASLAIAEAELQEKERELNGLNNEFSMAMAEKQKTQDQADITSAKADAANKLISGLGGEKIRWTAQSKEFAAVIRRLVGDVTLACGFVSYCGPFNAIFRDKLLHQSFRGDCEERGLPVSANVVPVSFLLDDSQLGQFAVEGLPSDKLSLENGLMTTKATRWPIMVDPQNQANTWIKNRESPNGLVISTLADKRFRQKLETTMGDGIPLLIQHIEEEIDPVMDPVLNKLIIRQGKSLKINLPDKEGCDYNDNFKLYFTTKLANPHYTPELSAQTTIIDFTVTMQGLEDQLLSIVVLQERPDLEETRQKLVTEIAMYKTKVAELEAQLLYKLANVQGNLLDDKDILDVLNNTKNTSLEVGEKLKAASETQSNINITCEDYRPVATRGSIIYFLFTECSQIDPMYQNSLKQFLEIFDLAMNSAEKNSVVKLRCNSIIDEATQLTWFFFTRGVFERHKILYTLLLAAKIDMKLGLIKNEEFQMLLKGGAALELKNCKKKPGEWMPDNSWLNLNQLSVTFPVFKDLLNIATNNEDAWHVWFDYEDPEAQTIPDFHGRLTTFQKLCLVRAFREDRTIVVMKEYVTSSIGKKYLDFLPLDIERVYAESTAQIPLIFLLSPGSTPDDSIILSAKRKKIRLDAISMGQGQEIKAAQLMSAAVIAGSWVLLQNTHLGLGYMRTLEAYIGALTEFDPGFRLWITCEPHPKFPIGLLQIAIKMTDEPPSGMKAGLKKSYSTFIDQDWLEAVNREEWRPMLYAISFLHSVVQERRKFGALGFCVPYEFNGTDLEASCQYVRNHMTEVEMKKGQPNWFAINYMVCEVQYGGRITDTLDRVLFATYGQAILTPKVFSSDFDFAPGCPTGPYKCNKFQNLPQYGDAIATMKDEDHPNVFGMHANADLTYRTKVTREMLFTVVSIQPKDSGGGGGGPTRDEVVLENVSRMLKQMPKAFNTVEVRKYLEKLNGGAGQAPKPLNIHLQQEIDRMQNVIKLTRSTMLSLELAIAGTVIMTPDLVDAANCIFDALVPQLWLKKSWPAPTLGLWFGTGLCNRTAELVVWLELGRPKSFWLTGYFNPGGFLTAVQQEVTRRHQGWSLDDIQVYTEISPMEKEECERKDRIEEGVYIWGLFLEAAAWDKKRNSLVDAPPKKLFCPIPCMFVTAIKRGEKKMGADYSCPCYTIPARTGQYYVFNANIKTDVPNSVWVLRGTALLCSKD